MTEHEILDKFEKFLGKFTYILFLLPLSIAILLTIIGFYYWLGSPETIVSWRGINIISLFSFACGAVMYYEFLDNLKQYLKEKHDE